MWPNLDLWPDPGLGPLSSLDWCTGVSTAPLWLIAFSVNGKIFQWRERRARRLWISAFRTALRRRLAAYRAAMEHASAQG